MNKQIDITAVTLTSRRLTLRPWKETDLEDLYAYASVEGFGQMAGWVLAVVLLREFAVSGMRLVAVEQGRVIAAAWSGKIKTASTMVGLCVMMLAEESWFPVPRTINFVCVAVILVTTVYSGIEYFWKNRDVFRSVK